jgi:RNA polymerase sigma factor (sigma-70 family)
MMETQSEDRVYGNYCEELGRVHMPASAMEERILFYRYHECGDPIAKRKLIEGGLRFVVKTAMQFYRGDTDFLKILIAAGNTGLVVAVDRYMPWVIACHICEKANYVQRQTNQRCKACAARLRKQHAQRYATRFLTYAHWWITESIRTELYGISTVHIPPYKQKEHYRRRKAGEENVGLTYAPYDDTMEYAATAPTEEVVIENQACRFIQRLLSKMNPREAYVISTYFGLQEEPKNLREISKTLRISPERVRQLKVKGMTNLRVLLEDNQVSSAAAAFS